MSIASGSARGCGSLGSAHCGRPTAPPIDISRGSASAPTRRTRCVQGMLRCSCTNPHPSRPVAESPLNRFFLAGQLTPATTKSSHGRPSAFAAPNSGRECVELSCPSELGCSPIPIRRDLRVGMVSATQAAAFLVRSSTLSHECLWINKRPNVAASPRRRRTGPLVPTDQCRNGLLGPAVLRWTVVAPWHADYLTGYLAQFYSKLGALLERTPRALVSTVRLRRHPWRAQTNCWREAVLGQGAPKPRIAPRPSARSAYSVHEPMSR